MLGMVVAAGTDDGAGEIIRPVVVEKCRLVTTQALGARAAEPFRAVKPLPSSRLHAMIVTKKEAPSRVPLRAVSRRLDLGLSGWAAGRWGMGCR